LSKRKPKKEQTS